MKKITVFLAALAVAFSVNAQETTSKHSVALDEVATSANIQQSWIDNLRAEILEGLIGTGRVEVVDVTTVEGLPSGEAEKMEYLADNNAECLLKCQFNSLSTTRKVDDNGKYSWTTKANYTLTLMDLETGGVKTTKTYEEFGYSTDSETESIKSAVGDASNRLTRFVEEAFPLSANVKALDKIHPKKGVETIYITIGSNAGVQPGQPFDAFVETDIAGEIITKKIEKCNVKVKEVVSAGLSLASVSGKGAVELQKAFENGEKVILVSRPKLLDSLTDVL